MTWKTKVREEEDKYQEREERRKAKLEKFIEKQKILVNKGVQKTLR